jgi:hypothetical protein
LRAVERTEHADVVHGRSDVGADAVAEWLPVCAAAEAVVTEGAGWLANDLQLASVGLELEKRLPNEVDLERERLSVRALACRSSSANLSRRRFCSFIDGTMSIPQVSSAVPWMTRPSAPMTMYMTSFSSRARKAAIGSNTTLAFALRVGLRE